MKGVNFMPRGKRMFSEEHKLEIVKKHLDDGISLTCLARDYHIDKGSIQKWRDAYLEHGVEGLSITPTSYSFDYKIAAVEYMHNTGSSMRQTAAHFNIKSIASLRLWERIYYEEGPDALREERRGGASKLGKINKPRSLKNNVNKDEDLLAEVQRLRMENEYLKKLNALIQEREKSEKKTK